MSKFLELIGEKTEQDREQLEANYTELAERLRKEMQDKIDEAFSALIGDYMPFIASDLYANLFSQYSDWLCKDYTRVGAEFGKYKAKDLREKIYREFKDEIVVELNQDNLERIKQLEESLEHEREFRRY